MKTASLPDTPKPIAPPRRNVNAPKAVEASAPAQTEEEKPATKLPPLADRTLADILDLLCRPFHLQHIELKPGATTQDKSRAPTLPYVDSRIYQKRLDYLAGVDGWRAKFESWGATRLICRLTILGVTKEMTGEGDASDPDCGTIADAQVFKRACSAFGCRRYLYDLPQRWFDYDGAKKRFVDGPAQREIYRQGALL
jgi:hypothetical protein